MMTIIPVLFGLIGCGDKEDDTALVIQQSFILEDEMQGASGCSDFVFYDHNEDDSMSLEINGTGLAALAHSTGEVQIIEVDLGSESDYEVKVNMGQDLTHRLCGDVFDPELETIVDTTYLPANGTLTLTITPEDIPEEQASEGQLPSQLEVRIQSADFCADIGNGDLHHENCFGVSDYTGSASIGWFHG
jgi:hypothetical protein